MGDRPCSVLLHALGARPQPEPSPIPAGGALPPPGCRVGGHLHAEAKQDVDGLAEQRDLLVEHLRAWWGVGRGDNK